MAAQARFGSRAVASTALETRLPLLLAGEGWGGEAVLVTYAPMFQRLPLLWAGPLRGRAPVGWAERSEAQHSPGGALTLGFATLSPTYAFGCGTRPFLALRARTKLGQSSPSRFARPPSILRYSALSTRLAPSPTLPRARGRETTICVPPLLTDSRRVDAYANFNIEPPHVDAFPLQPRRATQNEGRSRAAGWRGLSEERSDEFRSQALQASSAGHRAQRGEDVGAASLVTFLSAQESNPPAGAETRPKHLRTRRHDKPATASPTALRTAQASNPPDAAVARPKHLHARSHGGVATACRYACKAHRSPCLPAWRPQWSN
jgi:hypothetical protein